MNLPVNPQVDVYPPFENCYWAVVEGRVGGDLEAIFRQLERMEEQGEQLCGDIIGRLLLRRRDDEGCFVVHEFWIPFEKA